MDSERRRERVLASIPPDFFLVSGSSSAMASDVDDDGVDDWILFDTFVVVLGIFIS